MEYLQNRFIALNAISNGYPAIKFLLAEKIASGLGIASGIFLATPLTMSTPDLAASLNIFDATKLLFSNTLRYTIKTADIFIVQ